MKTSIIFFLISLYFFFLPGIIYAQPPLWEIYTNSNQPFVNVVVDRYESDSLYLKFMERTIVLHQDSVKFLLQRKESHFGLGFLMGALLGGILGGTTSYGSDGLFSETGRSASIFFGSLIGGALGGFTGLAMGTDNKYYLDKLNPEAKRKLLNRLFHQDL